MIVMVSPSESSRDETTSHEDFYTLTKDSLPQIDVVNGVETMIVDGGCTEAERAVDLGKYLDNLWRNYIMRIKSSWRVMKKKGKQIQKI
ncbi:hypothetical protein LOK49_LG02G01910 [Camellia lanceoleosa]|uniref:Uncharacterized protein n=1 Tax=Camellia lanceoleosa TaxID=1840588 RepID=A0ACC0IPV3_9ERIC|nr:hypothetical protein LOK49_LG02G01910 [Camellia lanceoleosa]